MPAATKYTDEQREAIVKLAESGLASPEIARRLREGEGPCGPVDIPARTIRRYVTAHRRRLEVEISRFGGDVGRAQAQVTAEDGFKAQLEAVFKQWLSYTVELGKRGLDAFLEPVPHNAEALERWGGKAAAIRRAEGRARDAGDADLEPVPPPPVPEV